MFGHQIVVYKKKINSPIVLYLFNFHHVAGFFFTLNFLLWSISHYCSNGQIHHEANHLLFYCRPIFKFGNSWQVDWLTMFRSQNKEYTSSILENRSTSVLELSIFYVSRPITDWMVGNKSLKKKKFIAKLASKTEVVSVLEPINSQYISSLFSRSIIT